MFFIIMMELFFFFCFLGLFAGFVAGLFNGHCDVTIFKRWNPAPNPLSKIIFTYQIGYRITYWLCKPYEKK